MTFTHAQPESERAIEKKSARKYECLFMCAVNDPNYDERTNNNAHKTQQQLDLPWWKVPTPKSWDVWRKVLTIIFVHSVCQQQQRQRQLHCIFDYLYTLQCSLAHSCFHFPVFFHVEWSTSYVCIWNKKPSKFIHSTRLFPTHSLTVRANFQRITPLFNFSSEFSSLVFRLTWNFLYRKFIQ